MKNILIFGHSRAGKTTLAQRLGREFQMNIINEDHLVNTFGKAFPALGIGECHGSLTSHDIHIGGDDIDYERTTRNITPFMAYYLCELANHARQATGTPFVADLTFFDFDVAIPLMQQTLADACGMTLADAFIFIGLDNHKTIEALFADIRKHDTAEDWTHSLSDDELLAHCAENVGADEAFYEKWRGLAWQRYDVTEGRKRVFDRIAADLKI
ncbi:MAG: hypothetical protein FWC71_07030 [Defluviitaleaceae bacterium]|nr:hypothetical protein [Defluviitaleaceae bacterium]